MEIIADWNQVTRYAKSDSRTDIIDFNGYWAAISRSWYRWAGR
ncbi:hypothetical protein [Microvirga guangxiensis]|uniref:Uncharacterized protein n=1 Tax=Microvirga guangxiensis TaxID=549386 RepID=A0A1G5LJZ1_9HYPH|nr:hypothetical protein [Microvirga guangxiensis]SCZ12608.1 hypothetical protein SAMN02927923_04357 [Microvirga guangxiensis]